MDPSSPSSPSSPSLKHKLRSSICFSCCFRGDREADDRQAASLIRSSSAWIRSKAPEIGDRYRTLVSRIGAHRHRQSGDFRYDPLDYALNFDDGGDADEGCLAGDAPNYRNFSSRLPASPPPPPPAVAV
ncbi:hypothetical protein J5N97_002670 [Dioscorea zingiberensis]|uniref:Uncharacterized protein n=1 Tax=Dioscorea zingiberensis TaxID=325984 RepID=A0A9D5D457_9LILI|nr:hypothetical protein J5N97_002670 [Dioscorea zingiberensis]